MHTPSCFPYGFIHSIAASYFKSQPVSQSLQRTTFDSLPNDIILSIADLLEWPAFTMMVRVNQHYRRLLLSIIGAAHPIAPRELKAVEDFKEAWWRESKERDFNLYRTLCSSIGMRQLIEPSEAQHPPSLVAIRNINILRLLRRLVHPDTVFLQEQPEKYRIRFTQLACLHVGCLFRIILSNWDNVRENDTATMRLARQQEIDSLGLVAIVLELLLMLPEVEADPDRTDPLYFDQTWLAGACWYYLSRRLFFCVAIVHTFMEGDEEIKQLEKMRAGLAIVKEELVNTRAHFYFLMHVYYSMNVNTTFSSNPWLERASILQELLNRPPASLVSRIAASLLAVAVPAALIYSTHVGL
ncbi:hypothetical protein BJ508DRAFT_331444 [Ascobolus immersus RN42]|uniref:Uncharacterized protein n=1 Tax=Ascobolus immersus RN42 TaxID=1160509 RepID=A0A3N4HS76_ASCIM|nr:hypothetical protein BJ508DRAFT_331444 [Ascobolus immersus RN42]